MPESGDGDEQRPALTHRRRVGRPPLFAPGELQRLRAEVCQEVLADLARDWSGGGDTAAELAAAVRRVLE